jgi:lipopolysaccharide export system protein LptA
LAADTRAQAQEWEWGQSAEGKPAVKLYAKDFRQTADSNKAELRGIELRIYQKDGQHFDRVRSESANFTTDDNKLFAPEVAEITLDVPSEGEAPDNLTSIKAGGVNFDSKTGKAVTDQPVSFSFAKGRGTCTGASYDPQSHELHLNHQVVLFLQGKPGAEPMKVEAEELVYVEQGSTIRLGPWSKLTRGGTTLEAGASVITVVDKLLREIDAVGAQGKDVREGRQLEYSAGNLHGFYNEDGELEKMIATDNAKMVATSASGMTTVTGSRVDLTFVNANGENELTTALVTGKGYVESRPNAKDADAKLLRADVLELHMRQGGREIERVNTHAAGTLEFLPALTARHRRVLKAERMVVNYGARNEVQSFHADLASTETWPSEEEKKRKPDVAYTSSKLIDAAFDADGQLRELRQADTFRYSEGVRRAQADTASLDNQKNLMTLNNKARISDDTGSTTADRIVINQSTGDFDANGHVATTRLPEKKKTASTSEKGADGGGGMLDDEAPTQGMADHVVTAERNQTIHYIGNAVLWQSANRLQAGKIDIDRSQKALVAEDHVISQFQEKEKPEGRGTKPVTTIVRASKMVYSDGERVAIYSGGADFRQPTMSVKAETLKAWLNDSSADSRVNHAFGDGKVEIVQAAKGRQRVGTGEHAEYYTEEGRILLSGGKPQLADSLRGNTKGEKLTYFTDNERLIVDGTQQQPVQSLVRRGKTQ